MSISELFSTERLICRPHNPEDIPFMMELNSDPQVMRYTGDTTFANEDEAAEVVRALQLQFKQRRLGRLVTVLRETGKRLGWSGFKWHDDEGGVDLGFRFLRAEWNKGYATEASIAALQWLVAETDITHVFAHAMEVNIGSVRALEKLGFIREPRPIPDHEGFERFILPPEALDGYRAG